MIDPNMEKPYILCGQINLNKSPTATTELAIHINDMLKNFRYMDEFKAGFVQKKDDNYKKRMASIGISLDDNDGIIDQPMGQERKKFSAAYKKAKAKTSQANIDKGIKQPSNKQVKILTLGIPFNKKKKFLKTDCKKLMGAFPWGSYMAYKSPLLIKRKSQEV